MNMVQTIKNIFLQFCKLDLPASVLDQIENSTISSIQESPNGAFANVKTHSSEIVSGDCLEISFVRTLVSQNEVADAILHFRGGKVEYLEIVLYEPDRGWGQLDGTVLR